MRTNPDVGKIYVLIKAKDSVAALKRLQNEVWRFILHTQKLSWFIWQITDDEMTMHAFHAQVVDTELFKCLQEIHGEDYDAFVARKLVPVVGDVRETNVGIAPSLADEIADQVDVIINSAANTTFDERFVIDATHI